MRHTLSFSVYFNVCVRFSVATLHVAYATSTRSRSDRVSQAKPAIAKAFADYKQQEFIAFILDKYIADGVEELAAKKNA